MSIICHSSTKNLPSSLGGTIPVHTHYYQPATLESRNQDLDECANGAKVWDSHLVSWKALV
jgi:hypothetical protein